MRICALAAVIAALVLVMPAKALAESFDDDKDWTVTYTSGGTLEDNFSASDFATNVSGLQPGDDITMTITLNHENDDAGDWYMSNEVIKSLEAGAANGSAYGYLLTYEGPTASRTLYDSEAVGGDSENTKGLIDATEGLADYFFLEGLSKGQTGTVKLVVSLDGETEGNAYFDTLAQLKMKFAVDPQVEKKTTTETRNVAKTGDETDLFPFFVAMAASGVLLLGIAIATLRRRKNVQERGLHGR